jgi:hypothetical protein
MDVQQGGAHPEPGPGSPGSGTDGEGSRVGLIVGVALALLVGLVAVVVLLTRDDPDETAATATATPTATATVTPSATATTTATATVTPTPTATAPPSEFPDLMADGLGPLKLRMTKQEALDTGLVSEVETERRLELIADPEALPGVFVCWDPNADSVTSFLVKDGSPITTPDGIGVGSTVDDLRAAYGILLQEREASGEVWYTVPVDDVGYSFFPTEQEMVMLAGTDQVVADTVPGSEPC